MLANNKYSHILEIFSFLVFAIFVLLVAFRPDTAQDYDFWWHLALGKWEVGTKSFLLTDIFSYTFPGKEWFNNTQLFDVPLYLLYAYLGNYGLYLIRLAAYGLSYFFLYKAIQTTSRVPRITIISLFIVSLLMVRQFARPEIIVPIFVSFYLYALYSFRYRSSKLIYVLPLVQILWVNTNGGYVFGPFLIGIFFGSEILRSLIVNRNNVLLALKNIIITKYATVFAVSLAAILINPYGFSIIKWFLFFFGPQNINSESPPLISELQAQTTNEFLHLGYATPYKLLLILLGTALIYRIWVRLRTSKNLSSFFERLNYEDLIISIYFLYLSVQYIRFISLFAFVAPLIILKNMHFAAPTKSTRFFFTASFAASLIFFTTFYSLYTLAFHYPKESIEFIRTHAVAGPLFHTYELGGYLAATLYPEYQVFIDGRTVNLYDKNFSWYYRHLHIPAVFDAASQKYQFNAILIPPTYELARPLIDSEQWALVFFDNESLLLLKDNEQNKELISKYSYRLLDPSRKISNYQDVCKKAKERDIILSEINRTVRDLEYPVYGTQALSFLATKCPDMSWSYELVASLLRKSLRVQPNNAELYYNLGSIQLLLEQEMQALASFKRSIQIQKNSFNMTGLGITLNNLGRYQEAEKIFKKVLFLPDGDNPPNEYYQVYGRVSYQLDNNRIAIELFHRYFDLVGPGELTPQDYLDLSNAYRDAGDKVRAEEYLQKSKSAAVEQ